MTLHPVSFTTEITKDTKVVVEAAVSAAIFPVSCLRYPVFENLVTCHLSLAALSCGVAGEPQWLRGPIGRPLEPDAGNAAEGSEGPMPDWRFQPCDLSAHGFFVVNNRINQEPTKPGKESSDGSASWLRGFQVQSL